MQESRDNQIFFSRGIEELTLPLVHIWAPTMGIAPLPHKEVSLH